MVLLCDGDRESRKMLTNGVKNPLVKPVDGILNMVPVAGHAKGGIHYICGDKEGGDAAMKSTSRTISVIGGAAGGMVAGPAGAIAGGIAGGQAMDMLTTAIDSKVHGEYRLNGVN